MPVSSTPSRRVALAPLSVNTGSPRKGKGLLPLTPSLTPKLGLPKSASVIVPGHASTVATASASFSEYKITNSRNVKADLAATKLKLRLQLAFYKLKQTRDTMVASCPLIRVGKASPPRPRTFHGLANVNLQKPRGLAARPLLTAVAQRKRPTSLRLYHIKQLSLFHNVFPHKLPLSAGARLPPVHKILKTPIKTTSRMLATANSDETIDDTADDTHIDVRRGDVLGLLPLRCTSFGTPNSFSVAKSLLQLGLGYY